MAEWLLCFIERAIWLQYRASNESLEGTSLFEKDEHHLHNQYDQMQALDHHRRGGTGSNTGVSSAGIDNMAGGKSTRGGIGAGSGNIGDTNVPLKLLTLKDQKNQPIFVGPEHHNI